MAKFKQFIESDLGLGNLGSKLWQTYNALDAPVGAFLSSDVSGSEQSDTQGSAGHPLHLPSTDLVIPKLERTGRIQQMMLTKNPIMIQLSDGTQAYFSYDEYRRIQGEPALGKTMTIIFQRHPGDKSQMASKIDKAVVRD